uniref:Uncharacterized protein n=1 Tax=Arundo donax TaxID=35708 RepID=A0A0A9F3D7_ARUDO
MTPKRVAFTNPALLIFLHVLLFQRAEP